MRYFEKPIMNISKFDFENVVTEASGVVEPTGDTVAETTTELKNAGVSEGNTFTFTF